MDTQYFAHGVRFPSLFIYFNYALSSSSQPNGTARWVGFSFVCLCECALGAVTPCRPAPEDLKQGLFCDDRRSLYFFNLPMCPFDYFTLF